MEHGLCFVAFRTGQRQKFRRHVCSLVADAVRQGRKVALFVPDAAQARRIDEGLWSFDDESFIPHSVLHDGASPLDGAVIVHKEYERTRADTYLNFTSDVIPPRLLSDRAGPVEVFEFFRLDDDAGREEARTKWEHYDVLGLNLRREEL